MGGERRVADGQCGVGGGWGGKEVRGLIARSDRTGHGLHVRIG